MARRHRNEAEETADMLQRFKRLKLDVTEDLLRKRPGRIGRWYLTRIRRVAMWGERTARKILEEGP